VEFVEGEGWLRYLFIHAAPVAGFMPLPPSF
jgi:hypothetical protein